MKEPAGIKTCVNRLRAALASSLLIAGFPAGSPAAAGSFQVNPVHITMDVDRQTASITIRNTDSAEVAARVVAYRWTQVNGQDVYSETTDVIASPPIFTIAPGATQLVRVGLKVRRAGGAYRVIVEEIPRKQASASQVQVTLRLNLPLYLLPANGGAADLKWTAWRDSGGDLFVEAANRGSLHAQILEIGATTASGESIVLSKQMGVVLPSGAKHWKLGKRAGLAVGVPLLLTVRKSTGESHEKIQVEQR